MSDIRSFFGGGSGKKSAPAAPAEPVVNTAPPASTTKGKSPRKRAEEDADFDLVDSDEEGQQKTNSQRKRLKNAKAEKEAAAKLAAATPTKKAADVVVDLADTPQEKLKKAASPVKQQPQAKTPVKEEKPLLKPLKAASPLASGKKTVVANPFEFFGAPMPLEEEQPKETLKPKKEPASVKKEEAASVKKEEAVVAAEAKSTPVKKRTLPSSMTGVMKTESPVKKLAVESADSSPVPASASAGLYFDNMRIGVTGVTRIMPREEMEAYILENGGKLASSISGKTSLLVIGDILEDGRAVTEGSKYRTAKEKKVKIVTEEEFLQMYDPATRPTVAAAPIAVAVPSAAAKKLAAANFGTSASSSAANTGNTKGPEINALWVDKYKPQSPSDLIGHGEMVRKFGDWLKSWHAIHIAKTAKPSFNKSENTAAKAVLLSGPPGIGKTSLATTMAKMFGYDILELNASDTRNKREIEEKLTEAVSTKAINAGAFMSSSSGKVGATKHRLVIMDEVDGMGGSDRGGVAELIKVIKLSKIPVVCICNDRQSQKIKSLANYCYDLRVKRPTKTQIATRLMSIALAEGVTVEQNAAEMLVEQSGNDIRQALNALQMWSYGKAAPVKSAATNGNNTAGAQVSYMSYSDVKAGLHRIEKDKVLRQSPFDACGMLLSGYHKVPSFDDRYNSFFIDYSLVPLLVQQNYVDASKSGVFRNPQLNDLQKLELLSQASDAVSDVDMVGSKIRGQDQHWELLPTQATFCMRVGNPIVGFQAFPGFPQWLGKYSATNKKIRLTKELVQHSSLSIGQGFIPMRLDYVPYLRNALLNPLVKEGKEGISATVKMLEFYGLTKEDFMESLREMQFTTEYMKNFKDMYDTMDTQTKTALTKYYNTAGIMSSTVVPELAGMKKGKKKSNAAAADEDEEGLLDEDGAEAVEDVVDDAEEEEEDVEALRAQLLKSKPASKAKAAKGEPKAAKAGAKKK